MKNTIGIDRIFFSRLIFSTKSCKEKKKCYWNALIKINRFLGKMKNWQRKIESGNTSMLYNVSTVNKEVPATLQTVFRCHISKMITKVLSRNEEEFIICREKFFLENDRLQSELIYLKCDLSAKKMVENSSMEQFWINMQSSYPVSYTHLTLPTIYSV